MNSAGTYNKYKTQERNTLLNKALSDIYQTKKKARKCKKYCLEGITEGDIRNVRTKFWTKSYDNRAEWFMDKVNESVERNGKLTFLVEGGRSVCGNCFQNLLRMNKNFYYSHLKKAKQGYCSSGYRRGRGVGRATETAIAWLDDYGVYHADRMPVSGDLMLPYRTRKIDLYLQYFDEKAKNMKYSVSQSQFYKIWDTKFKKLKIKQVRYKFGTNMYGKPKRTKIGVFSNITNSFSNITNSFSNITTCNSFSNITNSIINMNSISNITIVI